MASLLGEFGKVVAKGVVRLLAGAARLFTGVAAPGSRSGGERSTEKSTGADRPWWRDALSVVGDEIKNSWRFLADKNNWKGPLGATGRFFYGIWTAVKTAVVGITGHIAIGIAAAAYNGVAKGLYKFGKGIIKTAGYSLAGVLKFANDIPGVQIFSKPVTWLLSWIPMGKGKNFGEVVEGPAKDILKGVASGIRNTVEGVGRVVLGAATIGGLGVAATSGVGAAAIGISTAAVHAASALTASTAAIATTATVATVAAVGTVADVRIESNEKNTAAKAAKAATRTANATSTIAQPTEDNVSVSRTSRASRSQSLSTDFANTQKQAHNYSASASPSGTAQTMTYAANYATNQAKSSAAADRSDLTTDKAVTSRVVNDFISSPHVVNGCIPRNLDGQLYLSGASDGVVKTANNWSSQHPEASSFRLTGSDIREVIELFARAETENPKVNISEVVITGQNGAEQRMDTDQFRKDYQAYLPQQAVAVQPEDPKNSTNKFG